MLRVEDTDRERSTQENVEQILNALRWLELDWDEGPISQWERRERHAELLAELVEAGRAYPDPATSEEVRSWKAANAGAGYRGAPSAGSEAAIRLRVPDDGETIVADVIRGEIRFENRLQDDPVIARSDGSVLYNFAVAVDDADQGITDVVRGDDHLSNTPKQLLVLAAIGADAPRYAHLPLLHGPDGSKLSKRHGAASVQELAAGGYLPVAVRNYLALLGWGTQDDTTLMQTEDLVERFSVERVGRSSAIFDEKKLRWMNGRFMREASLAEYEARLADFLASAEPAAAAVFASAPPDRRRSACEIVQEKAQTLGGVWPLVGFLFEEPVDDPDAWTKVMSSSVAGPLEAARNALEDLDPFDPSTVEASLGAVLEREGVRPKELYQPLRVAITGTTISPGIFESVAALGRQEAVARVEVALARLASASASAGA